MRNRERNFQIEKRSNGTVRAATINNEPSMAHDEYREQSDVNYIMNRFNKTGEITHITNKKGVYIDTTNLPDYQTALQTVLAAEDAFMALPAEIRKKFDNNPQVMIDYLEDPKNHKEAVSLGLMEEKEIPTEKQILNELKISNKNKNKNDDNSKNQSKSSD